MGIDDTAIKPLRSDDVIFFPSGTELCLHHIGSGEYYLLNEVAQDVWNLCNGALSTAEIAVQIAAIYEVSIEDVTDDVRELVEYLHLEECLL